MKPLSQSFEKMSTGVGKEQSYEDLASELSVEDLRVAMTIEEAGDIIRLIETEGAHLGQVVLSESAAGCRYNRAVYPEKVEDYIFESPVIEQLIAIMRQTGQHSDAERVRLLRSARARKFIHCIDETSNGL